jgi:D-glycero-D-manno-heptose 1,7-bisphosphate phosphatase
VEEQVGAQQRARICAQPAAAAAAPAGAPQRITQAVINVGGLGTRLQEVAPNTPKALVDICGRSVLERELAQLCRQGLCDIILTVGHLAEQVEARMGDGSGLDLAPRPHIRYFHEVAPLGSAGAILAMAAARPSWLADDFVVINGDIIFNLDLCAAAAAHLDGQALATIVTHPSSHPQDSMLAVTDAADWVRSFQKGTPQTGERDRTPLSAGPSNGTRTTNRASSGIYLLNREACQSAAAALPPKADLDHDLISYLLPSGRVRAYQTSAYIHEMGTPERLSQVRADVAAGRV